MQRDTLFMLLVVISALLACNEPDQPARQPTTSPEPAPRPAETGAPSNPHAECFPFSAGWEIVDGQAFPGTTCDTRPPQFPVFIFLGESLVMPYCSVVRQWWESDCTIGAVHRCKDIEVELRLRRSENGSLVGRMRMATHFDDAVNCTGTYSILLAQPADQAVGL